MTGIKVNRDDKTISDPSARIRFSDRLANALPFLTIVLGLGAWSAGFYALQESDSQNITEGLRCITFFGGLSIAALLGALAGGFLKRLVKRAFFDRSAGENKELS